MANSNSFKIFGFQIDVARQIERPERLLDAVKGMGSCGYNLMMLYLEDAFQYERHPGVSRKHAYSLSDMKKLSDACQGEAIELVPVIPALGHCGYITDKKGYEDYDEGRGSNEKYGTISPSFPESYQLLQELFEDWCHNIPGKYLHVGLDESPHMGQYVIRNKCIGKFSAVDMFSEHCNRLNQIAKSMDRQMVMWGDMFYHFPDALKTVDKDIIIADWYYYAFDKTPRVESFNFSAIDSARIMKEAGFQVWGVPSVWPNFPFAPIEDRLQNLKDWVRYGKAVGIEGIVNTDWENSFGFYDNSDLLYRVFGKVLTGKVDTLNKGLTAELGLSNSPDDNEKLITDILELGDHTVCGHMDRKLLLRPLPAMISTASQRHQVYRQKSEILNEMFSTIDLRTSKSTEKLRSIHLCYDFLRLFWNTGRVLSDSYQELITGKLKPAISKPKFAELGDAFQNFINEYSAFWDQRRYPDDPKRILKWCKECHDTLTEWGDLLTRDLNKHPLLTVPRLELTLSCNHPALPIIETQINYEDGTIQHDTEIMIRFNSEYAIPDKQWHQFPVIPFQKHELPKSIDFSVAHYGQIGIEKVQVLWNGKSYIYRIANTSGKNIQKEGNGTCWLGPIGATPADPTIRQDKETATYTLLD